MNFLEEENKKLKQEIVDLKNELSELQRKVLKMMEERKRELPAFNKWVIIVDHCKKDAGK